MPGPATSQYGSLPKSTNLRIGAMGDESMIIVLDCLDHMRERHRGVNHGQ